MTSGGPSRRSASSSAVGAREMTSRRRVSSALAIRLMRSSMLDVLSAPYIRTARAAGLSEEDIALVEISEASLVDGASYRQRVTRVILPLTMRTVLLVKAVEEADTAGRMVPPADRIAAAALSGPTPHDLDPGARRRRAAHPARRGEPGPPGRPVPRRGAPVPRRRTGRAARSDRRARLHPGRRAAAPLDRRQPLGQVLGTRRRARPQHPHPRPARLHVHISG